MADTKLTDMTALTSLAAAHEFYVNAGGNDRKVTTQVLHDSINNLTDDSGLLSTDLMAVYDASAAAAVKATIAEILAVSHNHAASEITSGTLTHERGGLEADVSTYDGLVRITGGATSAETVTAFALTLLDDADAATARTTLGAASSSEVSAITSGYARRKKVINRVDNTAAPPTEVSGDRYLLDNTGSSHGDWDGAAGNDIVEYNGTTWDATTPTEGWIVYNDTDNLDWLFVDDGSPAWQSRATGAGISSLNGETDASQTFSNDTNVTISSASGVHTVGWMGSLAVARGGTGATTLTDGGILLGSGTGAVTAMSVLATGEIVVGDGTTDPIALSALDASNRLKHEYGGIEADISAGDGFVQVKSGTGSVIKTNHAGTTAPTATDDSGSGYAVGSRWIDTTNDKEYVCLDATTSAAVWTETTGAGGAGDNLGDHTATQDLDMAGFDIHDIGFITDSNDNEALGFTAGASAVNYLNITTAATGVGPILAAAGSDTNVDLRLLPKAAGNATLETTSGDAVVQSATGTVHINAVDTGAYLRATSNTGEFRCTAGTGEFTFTDSNGNQVLELTEVASAVNFLEVAGATTTNDPTITADGDDTNVGIDLQPKGTGNITLGNYVLDGDQTVGAGQDNYVLTYDNTAGHISLEAASGGGGGLSNVVEDTTPQLGGTLDVNGNAIGDGTEAIQLDGGPYSPVETITDGATGTADLSKSNVFKWTLPANNDNRTLAFSNAQNGMRYVIRIDASSWNSGFSATFTWPSGLKWVGGMAPDPASDLDDSVYEFIYYGSTDIAAKHVYAAIS